MRILYIGDNRIRGNYGCRATSTALSLIVGSKHSIVGRVTGNVTFLFPRIVYFKYFPSFIYKILGKLKYWNKVQPFAARVCYKLQQVTKKAEWFDFISHDMEKSIKNLKKCLPANPVLSELNIDQYDFDAMVVNGEGSFIFCTPQWREPLVMTMCMYWAEKLGKKVFFMNAMFSDRPNNTRNEKTLALVNEILGKAELVVARENISFNYVKEHLPDVKPVLIPDALFSWYNLVNDSHVIDNGKYYLSHDAECDEAYYNLDFTEPYILISGSSSAKITIDEEQAISSYSSLVKELRANYNGNIFLIQVCEGDTFLKEVSKKTSVPLISMETPIIAAAKILANAQAYVSGRYHPAIMASLGGTPCVFMGSNSHKTWSLQALLEYDKIMEYDSVPSAEEIKKIVADTIKIIGDLELRDKIKHRAKSLADEAMQMKNLI
ncbi:MAG TPA: polysaccharide pyruvyl transferase family protein [Muribaculum sp.]|uniref:Polysaccharide pyruvyl transferase family protein n=1 Tax=Heminiphilus faecis TaxID=2601703 RepID=A0ABV4CZC3_9BACT|nr:polysaccharide pyruvyl transferase family protein [Heminiphilus faecis]RLT76446.1 polysaccharide pyruvyl transferase family protein [bacterium J10(2018)]HRF68408.1 polysaccharide pyruvyl transferase family protein [Muribaculum sp.]